MIITKDEYDSIMNDMPKRLSSDIKGGDPTHIDDHITIAQFLFGPTPIFPDITLMKLTRAAEDEWTYTGEAIGEDLTFTHNQVVESWSELIPDVYLDLYLGVESQKGLADLPANDWPIGSSLSILNGGLTAAVGSLLSFASSNPANLSAYSIWSIMQLIGDIKLHQCYQQGVWSPPLPDEASTQRQFWNGHNLLISSPSISAPEAGDKIWSIIPRSTDQTRIADLEARIAALEANTP